MKSMNKIAQIFQWYFCFNKQIVYFIAGLYIKYTSANIKDIKDVRAPRSRNYNICVGKFAFSRQNLR